MAQPSLTDLLQQIQAGPAPQAEDPYALARDLYMNQASTQLDPLLAEYMAMGGANVKPGYRVDDVLALRKYASGEAESGIKGLLDMAQQQAAAQLAQQRFGLQQQQFEYGMGQDQIANEMARNRQRYQVGDPESVAWLLSQHFGGPEGAAQAFENLTPYDPNNPAPEGAVTINDLAGILGWVDANTGQPKVGPVEATMLQDAYKSLVGGGQAAQQQQEDPRAAYMRAMAPGTGRTKMARMLGGEGPDAGLAGWYDESGKVYTTSGRPEDALKQSLMQVLNNRRGKFPADPAIAPPNIRGSGRVGAGSPMAAGAGAMLMHPGGAGQQNVEQGIQRGVISRGLATGLSAQPSPASRIVLQLLASQQRRP